jgi:DNA repair protein RecO (recombination protein O)
MSAARGRMEDEHAFVLHTYPFRDTSIIVEAFTRRYGRVGLLAKGAKRPKSPLRAALLAFQPLALAWAGRGELGTLTRAESLGAARMLSGVAMMCGYYVNELVLKLLQRDDPHERLFDDYDRALQGLAAGEPTEAVLRRFELALLREIGYGVQLEYDAGRGTPLVAEERYAYWPERGPVVVEGSGKPAGALELRGKTLLDMARGDFSDPLTAAESKQLMRWLIGQHLDQRTLNTRQLLIELQQL